MKQFGLLAAVAVSACLSFSGCSNDVYNPENITPTQTGSNPLGEGFTAPSNFDWSMMNTVNLNVEVKDEFNGQYNYLIEVFTSNPLTDTSATPIAAGTAKKGVNYTTELNISKAVERLFIRQTDPKQRKEIYEYAVPTDGGTLNCQLYYTEDSSTKALSTRSVGSSNFAYNTAVNAGITDPTDPNYKEADTFSNIPTTSDQPANTWDNGNSMSFSNGSKLIIGSEYTAQNPYTKNLQVENGGRMAIYVKGVWKPSAINYAFDIYVLNGGTISSNSDLTLGSKTNLSIQSEGIINAKGTFTLKSQNVKNYGDIDVNTLIIDEATTLFNQGTIKMNGTNESSIGSVNTVVYNHGLIEGNKVNLVSAKILNTNTGTVNIQNTLYLNSGSIFNYGKVMLDEKDATLGSNGGLSYFVNHSEATLNSYNIYNGLTVYNDGFIETTNFRNEGSNDALYNSCTLIVKNEFKFRKVVLDKGSISGGRVSESSNEWVPVSTVTALNDATFTMQNGSMIKVKTFNGGNPCTFTATGGDASIIAAQIFKYNGTTNISGNLVWAVDDDNPSASWMKNGDGIANTKYDEAKYTIETCGGFFNQGNEGGNPSNPTVPVVEDATKYTYAFEDNWPAYGDLDLNDLVTELGNKSVTTNASGYVTKASFVMTLKAVGANKTLGLGIRFLKLSSSMTPSKFTMQGNSASFESGQTLPTLILFNNAHSQFSEAEGNEFINTSLTSGLTTTNDPQYAISVEFNASDKIPASAFNINNFDVFIISQAATAKTKRTEIHLPGYAPTDLANTTLFGSNDDSSDSPAGHYYLSTENLAWGIVVPAEFAWPLEYKKVTDVYGQFKTWITSGGKEDANWYTTHNSNVYTK